MIKNKYILGIILLFFVGCTTIPKIEEVSQDVSLIKENTQEAELKLNTSGWWNVYKDDDLEKIIDYTLKANKEIKLAELNIKKADLNILLVKSNSGPFINMQGKYEKERFSENDLMPILPGKKIIDMRDLSLSGSYDIDIFKKNSFKLNAALDRKESLEYSEKWVELEVTNKVVGLYAYYLYLKNEEYYIEKVINILKILEKMEKNKMNIGISTKENLLKIGMELKDMEISKSTNINNLGVTENSIKFLSGMKYNKQIEEILHNKKYSLNTILSKQSFTQRKVSSEIIINRPDVLYYLKMIDSQKEMLKSLKADFYPKIYLTGESGFKALSPKELFEKKALFGVLGLGVSLPIFNSGLIKNNYKFAGIDLNVFIEDYNKVLLNALNDVNNQLLNMKNLDDSLEISKEKFNKEKELYYFDKNREKIGMISKNEFLNSEYRFFQKIMNFQKMEYSKFAQEIKLINSLGGIVESK